MRLSLAPLLLGLLLAVWLGTSPSQADPRSAGRNRDPVAYEAHRLRKAYAYHQRQATTVPSPTPKPRYPGWFPFDRDLPIKDSMRGRTPNNYPSRINLEKSNQGTTAMKNNMNSRRYG
ncbi:uncharacterized protein LOC126982549 isoform X2 [Eriocheir sinensis]|uniref:uncharacterized protein LOC126982549 isoform X2 n=1 Tax=Eriocheir sinensis TaxID=95602 RepID=UPI0021CA9DBA|nr:uncharacterized protein LOC126982549 isoform X2 [Eriocheir sinensis]